MNKPIVLDTITAFRADPAGAKGTVIRSPDINDDAAPVPGAFTRQELRDLVLHWMG